MRSIKIPTVLAISLLVFASVVSFNAEAVNTTFITPDIEKCDSGFYLSGFNSDGSLICNELPESTITDGDNTSNSFTSSEEEKLKTFASKLSKFDDGTHTYIETKFNGVGENIRPSGGQFQIYCDKVETQNCTLWLTSADEKTGAFVVSKDEDGEWRKVFAITEATNHEDMNIIIYGENNTVPLTGQFHFKESGLEIWNDEKKQWCTLTPQLDQSLLCIR